MAIGRKRIAFSFAILFCFSGLSAQQSDINLLRKINLGRNKSLDGSFRLVSNSVAPLSFATPLAIYGAGLNNKDELLRRQGLAAGAGLILSSAISMSLKFGIHRKRPFAEYEDIQKLTRAGPYSFPSGHTTAAFATATSLSLAFPKWYVVAPSFAWAAAVGWSRMHLGVHYPSDVLAGILIGAGSSLLCFELQNRIR